MIFNKIINGKVLGYASAKEIRIPGYSHSEYEYTDMADYDFHYMESFYDEYCIAYEKLRVQYTIKNKEYETVFDRVILEKDLKESDLIRLNYNKIKKKVEYIL